MRFFSRPVVVVLGAAALLATGTADPAGAATAPSACTIDTLPIPDDVPMAVVTAADPTGSLIFGRSYPDLGIPFKRQVLRWVGQHPRKIDFPGVDQAVNAVNAAGLAVGSSFAEDQDVVTAYVVDGGAVIPLPGGTDAIAFDINDSGVIVGGRGVHAVKWSNRNSAAQELPVPPGTDWSEARGIDNDGTIVGTIEAGAKSVAWTWAPDGTGRPLPFPAGEQGQFGTRGFGIHNGWGIGIDSDAGDVDGLRWNLRTGRVEPVPDFVFGGPSAVNAAGWMVGTNTRGQAELQADGHVVVLPDLATHEPGNLTNNPETISEDGRIVAGFAEDKDFTFRAVVWHCA